MNKSSFEFERFFDLGIEFSKLSSDLTSILSDLELPATDDSVKTIGKFLDEFDAELEKATLENTQSWLRNEKHRKLNNEQSIEDNLKGWGFWLLRSLPHRIEEEISNKLYMVLPELPMRANRQALDSVTGLFRTGIFDQLPSLAKRDFEEATRCFIYGQSTAAAILVWRAAETTLKEYYFLLTGEEPLQNSTWGTIQVALKALRPPISNELNDDIERHRKDRNSLAHAERLDSHRGWRHVNRASEFISSLIEDIEERKRGLSIGLCSLNHSDTSFREYVDAALAFYLLHKYSNGVGRRTRISNTSDEDDFDYVIGFGKGRYSFSFGVDHSKPISAFMAGDLNVYHDHQKLIGFISKYRFSNAPSNVGKDLNGVLRAIKETSREGEETCWNHLFSLFSEIVDSDLDPFNPYIVQSLSGVGVVWYENRNRLKSIDVAWDNRISATYCGTDVAIVTASSKLHDMLEKKAFSEDYGVLALLNASNEPTVQIKIRPRTAFDIDLEPLYLHLKNRYRDWHHVYSVASITIYPPDEEQKQNSSEQENASSNKGLSAERLLLDFAEADPSDEIDVSIPSL